MEDTPETLPPLAIYLKRLVTVLAVVMIAGVVILITMLVIRFNADPLPLPDRISLPAGVEAFSFTQGRDWIGVVTTDDQILVYDRLTSDLRQTIQIETAK